MIWRLVGMTERQSHGFGARGGDQSFMKKSMQKANMQKATIHMSVRPRVARRVGGLGGCLAALLWVSASAEAVQAPQTSPSDFVSQWVAQQGLSAEQTSIWVGARDASGQPLQHQPHLGLVPASTIKLMTAWLALRHWSADKRFVTDVFLLPESDGVSLGVKGYGDPFMVSESLQALAQQLALRLRQKGLTQVNALRLDDGFFQVSVAQVPGLTQTSNPYDALPGALSANFNTFWVKKQGQAWVSAEPQTPLTPLIATLAQDSLTAAEGQAPRVNLGQQRARSTRYWGELLQAFLQAEGIEVARVILRSKAQTSTETKHQAWSQQPWYRFRNPVSLETQVKAMLRYSTNLIAHQLVLKLSAEAFGPPATMAKVRRYLTRQGQRLFQDAPFTLVGGAGLSRQNRLSAAQLGQLLQQWQPWRGQWLPELAPGVWAKTGTLHGVRSLAGYVCVSDCDQPVPFAVIMNQSVAPALRLQFAQALKRYLAQSSIDLEQFVGL